MAVDSKIALGVQAPDVMSAISGGLKTGEQLRTSGVREQLLQQKAQANQMIIEQSKQNQALQGVMNYGRVIDGLANIPDLRQRAKVLAQQSPMLEEAGIPVSQLASMDLSDAGLSQLQATIRPFLAKQQAQAPANVKSFEYFQNVLQSPESSEDQKKAARIELKLDAPATTDYQKSMLEIKEEAANLKRLEMQAEKETNELKKEKLKAEVEAKQAMVEQGNQKIIESVQRDVATIDSTLSTVGALSDHEGLDAAVGGTSIFPTLPGSAAADFEAKLEQLKGQQFLTEVTKMKGMGALSENEGKKLAAAASSLELSMSEDAFRKELKYIQDTMAKARNKLAGKLPVQPAQQNQAPATTELSDEDLLKQLGL
jgi:hypothetical protein